MKFANHYFQFIFTFYPTPQLVGLGVVMLWCKQCCYLTSFHLEDLQLCFSLFVGFYYCGFVMCFSVFV